MNMNQEAPKTWCTSITNDMILKVLFPTSIFAFLSGTFPADTALLHSLEKDNGMSTDAASATLLIKAYSAIVLIIPVVLLILAFGAKLVMFTGALAQLVFLLFWMRFPNFALTQLSCIFAGYASAAWIASCCYGRCLLPKEYYLLYYVCIGCCASVGQFLSTALDALAQSSVLDPSLSFLLASIFSALAALISYVWIPDKQYQYTPLGPVDQNANDHGSLRTNRYWRRLVSTFVVPIKHSPLPFLLLWFTFEYAVFLSTEATITDFLTAGSGERISQRVRPSFTMAVCLHTLRPSAL